jgi:B12-binding domain/radical SAM domain protein
MKRMSEQALVFITERYNRNSIAALCGALEGDERFGGLKVLFLNHRDAPARLEELQSNHDLIIVAFSFCTPNLIEVAQTLAALSRQLEQRENNGFFLMAGGPHPSGDWHGTLKLGFDCVVVGEGEISFPDLLERMLAGQDCGDIRGLACQEGGSPRYTGKGPGVLLDRFAPFSPKYRRFGPIEISRGCPWACSYCQTPSLFGHTMRHRSVEAIVRYAEIGKSYGLRDVRFITPNAFAYDSDGRNPNLRALERLLKGVGEIYGKEHVYLGSFPSEIRPDMVSREAVELIIRHAANKNLVIGAQSGSQRLLDRIHRGHSVADVYSAVKIVVHSGLVANVDIIFGLPGETEEDIRQTLKMMEDLTSMGARIHSHTFIPLAGTLLAQAPPGRVTRRTRTVLGRLASQGKQFGSWEKQEKIGQALVSFRKEKPP